MYNNVEVCTMIQNCTKECKRMQYAYSYAVYMMQCQGAWRHGGAYIHTPYTALIWQTGNDKEKQTLNFVLWLFRLNDNLTDKLEQLLTNQIRWKSTFLCIKR